MSDELARLLAAATEVFAAGVDLWRVVVPTASDPDQTGTRVYRGSFRAPVEPTPGPEDSQNT